MNCLNCGAKIAEEAKFCDMLCRYGYQTKQFKDMKENFKAVLKYYEVDD